jgi:uncharacterized protein
MAVPSFPFPAVQLVAGWEDSVARELQIVLKVSERCNINCSYCYYFNGGNEDFRDRPALISDAVVESVASFVEESVGLADIGQVTIILHGGEPLMLKKQKFRSMCAILSRLHGLDVPVTLAMTTNGMLVDAGWVDIFEEFDIRVCVSIDGPPEYHDRERLDFRGRGTYARVARGIEILQDAARAGRIAAPSALSVIDVRSSGAVVYDHVVRKLGVRCLDVLVPQVLHDDLDPRMVPKVARFLTEAFAEWTLDDDPGIEIRMFTNYLDRLVGKSGGEDASAYSIVIAVGSDGSITPDDSLKVIGDDIFNVKLNVRDHSVSDYLASIEQGPLAGVFQPHTECVQCKWYMVCRPSNAPLGSADARYSRANGFRNKLVYCDAYQELFHAIARYVRSSEIADQPHVAPEVTAAVPPC